MSQVIRKYAGGGSTLEPDVAPLEILGQYYDPESFKREVLGSKARSYVRAMGFNNEQTNQFMADLKDHVDRILGGTMTATDEGTLTNTDGSWRNTGKYAKNKKFLGIGKRLTEEQLRNNRSIDVTNYLINSLQAGAFSNANYNSPKEYSLNFDNLFQTKFHPGIDFSTYVKDWDSLDASDQSTGKKGTTNRLKSIGNLLLEEADKLDNDSNYRRQFSWKGWENKWEGRQEPFTSKLRDAARRLSDGEYSDDDKRYLASIGVNLDKYLSTTDEETTRRIEEAAERKKQEEEAAIAQQKQDNITKYGNAFQSALPWQTDTPILWWDGTSYTYNSPEYNDLYNSNTEAKEYIDSVYNSGLATKLSPDVYYDGYSLPSVLNGYDYAVDINDYFPILNNSRSYVIRKDPMDPSTAAVYIKGKRYSIQKADDNRYYAVPFGWKGENIILGEINPNAEAHPLTGQQYAPSFFKDLDLNNTEHLSKYFSREFSKKLQDHFKDAQLLYNWYLGGKGTAIGSNSRKAIRLEKTSEGYILYLDVPEYGLVKYYLKDNPGNRELKYSDLKSVVRTIYNKNGGILKAQAGVKLSVPEVTIAPEQLEQPTEEKNNTSPKLYASFSSRENARNQFLTQDQLTTTDITRLGSAITDLTSAVAGFVPGLNIASTVTGAASSLTDFGADMVDLANNRKGVSFWDSIGNLGLNLGMDAVSLLPGLKSFKATSALRRIASYVPHIAGAIQTYNLITDGNLKKSVGETLTKIKDLDISRLNTQDFRNLAYIGRTILGLKGAYGQITSRRSRATGDVEVRGTVKVNGRTERITATVPKGEIKTLSRNDKVAREALAEAANRKFGKPKTDTDEGLSFSSKDITLSTGNFGRARTTKVREEVNNEYSPKRAFEGWFGSKGKDWWFSDYRLSRSNNFWARQYGLESPSDRIKRITSERNKIHKDIENKGIVNYVKEEATRNSEVAEKIKGKSDEEILEIFSNKDQLKNFVHDALHRRFPRLISGYSGDEIYVRTKTGENSTSSFNVVERYNRLLQNHDNRVKSEMDKYHELQRKDRERTDKAEKIIRIENARKRNYREAVKQTEAQNNELIEERLRKMKEERTKYLINKYYTSRIITPTDNIIPGVRIRRPLYGKARQSKQEMYDRLFGPIVERDARMTKFQSDERRRAKNIQRREASERNYYRYADIIGKKTVTGWNRMHKAKKRKFIQENKEFFDQAIREYKAEEYFKNLYPEAKPFSFGGVLARYKSGGILVPKFQNSGSVTVNYLDWTNPFIDDVTFSEVNGIDPNQTFEGWSGTPNHRTWNNGSPTLSYPQEWYNSNHISQGSIGIQNVLDERNKYHESNNHANIFGDVVKAYDNWFKTNPNGTIEDYLKYYNDVVSRLRAWSKDKSKQPYGTTGQRENNQLFNTIYGSYTVGYDPKQEDILGAGTYRRVPNQFDNLNSYSEYRQGEIGGQKVWMDNAGYLRMGEFGRVVPPEDVTPDEPDNTKVIVDIERTDNTRNPKTKTTGGMRIDPGSMLGLTEVIAGLTANTQATKKLMESRPTLKQAPWINRYIFGNYLALARAAQSAGDLNTQASVPISSDATLAYAARQEANAKGRQLIDSGNQQNFETYWRSRENVQQGNEINEANAINTANENTAAVNAMRNAKLKWQADLITSNVAGNIKPWLSEQRSYINQNDMMRRRAELDYGVKLATLQAQDSQNRLMQSYLAKAKSSGIDTEGKTDEAILSEYLNDNPQIKEGFERELRSLQQSAYRRQLELYTDLNRIPVGLGLTYQPKRTYKYDYILGDYVESNKKGGSLTASDKMKLQRLKDFNKKMLSDSKESIKSIRENQREFGRMYRSMSAGTLALIKRAMQ